MSQVRLKKKLHHNIVKRDYIPGQTQYDAFNAS